MEKELGDFLGKHVKIGYKDGDDTYYKKAIVKQETINFLILIDDKTNKLFAVFKTDIKKIEAF